MYLCKRKTPETRMIAMGVLILGAIGAALALWTLIKKTRCCLGNKKDLFPDFDLSFDGEEKDVDFGCIVPDTNDDVRSDENAVVNSENRTINTPNPLMD